MNTNALKAEFVKRGMTQAEVAKAIGMSCSTLNRKLKNGTFGLDEANDLIRCLKIENPERIFFGGN